MANPIDPARAYDVAKELNLSSKELKQFILDENLGFTIKSHMTVLTGEQIVAIRGALGLDENGEPIEEKKEAKPKRTRARKSSAKKSSTKAEAAPAKEEKEQAKPKRTRSRKAKKDDAPAADVKADAAPAEAKKSRSRSKKADETPAKEEKKAAPKRNRGKKAAPKQQAPPADPMRVHELAKELGMKSGELIKAIAGANLGWEAKSHLTRLTGEQVGQARAALAKGAAPDKEAPKAKKAEKAAEEAPKKSRSRRSRKPKAAAGEEAPQADAKQADDKPKSEETKKVATPAAVENPVDEVAEEAFRVGRDYLKTAFADLGFGRVTVRPALSGDYIEFNVGGYNLEEVLGSTGAGASTDLLDSLEELTSRAIKTKTDRPYRVKIDLGGFREKRQSMLADAASRVGRFVKDSGKTLVFAVMNAIDRRALHSAFSEDDTIQTDSFGEGPLRRMAVRKR